MLIFFSVKEHQSISMGSRGSIRSCNKSQIEVGATIAPNFASTKVFCQIQFHGSTAPSTDPLIQEKRG